MNLTLSELLTKELQDLYSAEIQLTKALPKLAAHAKSDKLREAFEEHLEQTKKHVERLKEAGTIMDIKLEGEICRGAEGIIKEGDHALKMEKSHAADLALIGSARKAEHYEISAYTSAISHAEALEESDLQDLLDRTLTEEVEAESILTDIHQEILNIVKES